MLRLALGYGSSRGGRFVRLATAVGKFWVCKRGPAMLAEALECLGGGGYIEESCMPRLYREAPVNSVWEGPGNVICLDVLRALSKEPDRSRRSLPSCRGGVLRCPAAVARIDLRVMVWAKSWVDHLLERVG